MLTLNQIVGDKFDCIMKETRMLIVADKRSTVTSKDVETAVKLMIPGELGQNSVKAGRAALVKFSKI